jgi:hypothetical protein
MRKIIVIYLILITSCGRRLADKEVCEQDWQYMSDGTREKCANDRLINAMKEMHEPLIIHDTIYVYK